MNTHRLSPSDWLRANEAARTLKASAERAEAERLAAENEQAAQNAVADFYAKIDGGLDPFNAGGTLAIGTFKPDVASRIVLILTADSWQTDAAPATYIGPGGRGEMQSTYTDESVRRVTVYRPRK